jgi:hypothetical protein
MVNGKEQLDHSLVKSSLNVSVTLCFVTEPPNIPIDTGLLPLKLEKLSSSFLFFIFLIN